MKKYIFLAIFLFIIAGCAATKNFFGPQFVKVSSPRTVTITWIRGEPGTCGDVENAAGCAVGPMGPWEDAKDRNPQCIIYMPDLPNVNWLVIAEEFLHCFGYAHIGGTEARNRLSPDDFKHVDPSHDKSWLER